jgi:hypothetical protein
LVTGLADAVDVGVVAISAVLNALVSLEDEGVRAGQTSSVVVAGGTGVGAVLAS